MNPITFSTLACPNWQIETIIARAAGYGYDGIEWRGGAQGHVQPHMPAAQKDLLRQRSSESGLMSFAVTAYTSFTSDSAEERQANLDELQRYVDLAAELDAPYVRTFLGVLSEGTNLDASIYEKISSCLNKATEYADSVGVKIAVEPHDNFVHSSSILPVLSRIEHSALRVIWDIGNAYSAGEDIEETFGHLKDRLAYVQVKDGKGRGASWQLCSVGQGDVPLSQAFERLVANGYEGALSVEWEYAWHPELDPPEIALPAALQSVRNLLEKIESDQITN